MSGRNNGADYHLMENYLLRLSLIVGVLFIALTGVARATMTTAHIHDPDNVVSGNAEFIREMESRLTDFQSKTGIRVVVKYQAKLPTDAEDSAPGAFMRQLAAQWDVLENGVLEVYFLEADEWRIWIGNELTARFVGQPGTAAEFTASGAMHDAKEAWLEKVFSESQGIWNWWQVTSKGEAKHSDKVEFETIALFDGVAEKFLPEHIAPVRGIETAKLDKVLGMHFCLYDAPDYPALMKQAMESRDEKGRTALMNATHANEIELAESLITNGADVNARDELKDTPFLYAGAEGRLEILKLTLAHGADLTSLNRFEGTALIPAAEKGHLENVWVLLATEIDIDHVNRPGWTALYEAVMRPRNGSEAYRGIVQALLDAGADASIPDKQGRTPEQRAREVGNDDLAELIAATKQ